MGKTLLLTGHPACGKTTIIRKVVTQLGNRAGGFYTEEIFGPGGRKGFELTTLDGKKVIFAHKDWRSSNFPRVGRYGVDVAILRDVGVTAIQGAMQAGKIVVIDEIGKMELLCPAFRDVVMRAILGPNLILGTIIYKPHPEADVFKTLAQVTLWEVNQLSRDGLPKKTLAWLKEFERPQK